MPKIGGGDGNDTPPKNFSYDLVLFTATKFLFKVMNL